MSESKKCPKCGGEMVQGEFLKNLPKIVEFHCQVMKVFAFHVKNSLCFVTNSKAFGKYVQQNFSYETASLLNTNLKDSLLADACDILQILS